VQLEEIENNLDEKIDFFQEFNDITSGIFCFSPKKKMYLDETDNYLNEIEKNLDKIENNPIMSDYFDLNNLNRNVSNLSRSNSENSMENESIHHQLMKEEENKEKLEFKFLSDKSVDNVEYLKTHENRYFAIKKKAEETFGKHTILNIDVFAQNQVIDLKVYLLYCQIEINNKIYYHIITSPKQYLKNTFYNNNLKNPIILMQSSKLKNLIEKSTKNFLIDKHSNISFTFITLHKQLTKKEINKFISKFPSNYIEDFKKDIARKKYEYFTSPFINMTNMSITKAQECFNAINILFIKLSFIHGIRDQIQYKAIIEDKEYNGIINFKGLHSETVNMKNSRFTHNNQLRKIIECTVVNNHSLKRKDIKYCHIEWYNVS
jgi:hypothetical protein